MRTILTSRKGIHYESSKRGEAVALYIPGQDDPRVYRDLEGKSQKEIAERYGATGRKPLVRENHGEVEIYGILDEALSQRRHGMKAYLPQDFAPQGTYAFYYMLGKKYIVHGVRTVSDEGVDRWGNSLIVLQGGDPVKIVTSAISERMLDGDVEGICVAIDGNLKAYEGLKNALKPFNIKVTPFDALKVNRGIKPLYQHKDNSIYMVLLALLMLLACSGAAFFWWVNKTRVDQLNQKINRTRVEISNIQSNEKLGYILQPDAFLDTMKQTTNRKPSSFINAGAYVAKEFGELEKINIQIGVTNINDTESTAIFPETGERITMIADVQADKKMLLVDQEVLARSITATRPWLRKIENISANDDQLVLMIDMQSQLDEATPNE